MIIQILFVLSMFFSGVFVIRSTSIMIANVIDFPFGMSTAYFFVPALVFQIWYWTQPLFVGVS
jgi:hypothetical protein